ncbi:MAG: 5'-deoxyadenosine deaminase [Syntrophomonadaceae bacterium]|nr:5'-deoxyadenosine deaminase [Syntrophomonadaceae bacterium]
MSILIKNATIVTMNSERQIIQGDILIKNDCISQISEIIDIEADQLIDGRDKLVIPGLIQSHVHLCQVLFRGMADDMELLDWLKLRIWPLESSHDKDSLYYSALLGSAELLRGGTTAIIDMATVRHTGSVFEAVRQAGIRYLGGKCLMDYGFGVPPAMMDTIDNALNESLELISQWHGKEQNRIRYAFCPRFAVSCSDQLLRDVSRLSQQYNIPVHTHASENKEEVELVKRERGFLNVKYLDRLSLCSERLILAHCVHLDEEEMKILAESRSNIVHCPSANLKLASGIAPIPPLLNLGAKISLGADGAPCNNNLSMFMEMRLAALIHKPVHGPRSMPAPQIFEMATLGGARAMGMENEIGSLEVGKKADMAIVDIGNWHSRPLGAAGVYTQLVYQAQASDVYATIVDGKILMLNGQVLSLDPDEVMKQSEASLIRVRTRAGLL